MLSPPTCAKPAHSCERRAPFRHRPPLRCVGGAGRRTCSRRRSRRPQPSRPLHDTLVFPRRCRLRSGGSGRHRAAGTGADPRNRRRPPTAAASSGRWNATAASAGWSDRCTSSPPTRIRCRRRSTQRLPVPRSLVEEADPEELKSPAAAMQLLAKAMTPPGTTLQSQVSKDTFEKIAKRAEKARAADRTPAAVQAVDGRADARGAGTAARRLRFGRSASISTSSIARRRRARRSGRSRARSNRSTFSEL